MEADPTVAAAVLGWVLGLESAGSAYLTAVPAGKDFSSVHPALHARTHACRQPE